MRNSTLFLILYMVLDVVPLFGQWPTAVDSAIFVDYGLNPYLAVDEQEQSIIVVYRSGTERLAKKYDKYGVAQWGGSAVVLSDTLNGDIDFRTRVISDGEGGAIVCWQDYRHSTYNSTYGWYENNEVYAQRVDSEGLIRYGVNGMRISRPSRPGIEDYQSIGGLEPDYHGGFVVTYTNDSTNTDDESLPVVKRFRNNGEQLWHYFLDQEGIQLNTVDRDGNVFVSSFTTGSSKRYKLDIDGNSLWPDTLLGKIPDDVLHFKGGAFPDLEGGVIGAGWEWPGDIVVNRAGLHGQFVFGDEGVTWAGSSVSYYETDSQGGIYVNWTSIGIDYESRIQRVNRYGATSFGIEGKIISADSNSLGTIGIVANIDAGLLAMTAKGRNTTEKSYYACNIDSTGNSIWDEDGIPFHQTNDDPFFISLERYLYSDLRGGAIALWIEQGQGLRIMLKQISRNGNLGEVALGIRDAADLMPGHFELLQNYPNPFNNVTTIRYFLNKPGKIRLRVFNIIGEEVHFTRTAHQPVGAYALRLDLADLSSGVYIYQIENESQRRERKMLLIK